MRSQSLFKAWCREEKEKKKKYCKLGLLLKKLTGILPFWQFNWMRFSAFKNNQKQCLSLNALVGEELLNSRQTLQHLIGFFSTTGEFKLRVTAFNCNSKQTNFDCG